MADVERTVRSELLFREVNERIFELGSHDGDELEVLCECGDESCISTVLIATRDYERVRADGSRFVVRDGHEHADAERVVERAPDYLVVEKVGRAREIAERWLTGGAPT